MVSEFFDYVVAETAFLLLENKKEKKKESKEEIDDLFGVVVSLQVGAKVCDQA